MPVESEKGYQIKKTLKSFPQGIHPHEHKEQTQGESIQVLPTPSQLLIPFRQHIGAPCRPVINRGDTVAYGQLLAEEGGFVSTRIHASASGRVKLLNPRWHVNGRKELTAELDVAEDPGIPRTPDTVDWSVLESLDRQTILARIQESGIVGMGGAGFPTHVKLQPPETKPIAIALLNGCECEPYLNADNRLMIERSELCVFGFKAAMKILGAQTGIIAIESNKPEAASLMKSACKGHSDLSISILQTKYPQGGEKMTILAATGRRVPEGGLPMDVGVVVSNVGTAVAIAEAVLWNRPLTHRVLTVAGSGVKKPGNLLVPIGATIGNCLEFCGGLNSDACALIIGGPMMGLAITDLDVPVVKTTSGILALSREEYGLPEESACIRCARCVDHCPLSLLPSQLYRYAQRQDWDVLKKDLHLLNCMECGSCAYVCPAGIPLVQHIRVAKALLPR